MHIHVMYDLHLTCIRFYVACPDHCVRMCVFRNIVAEYTYHLKWVLRILTSLEQLCQNAHFFESFVRIHLLLKSLFQNTHMICFIQCQVLAWKMHETLLTH